MPTVDADHWPSAMAARRTAQTHEPSEEANGGAQKQPVEEEEEEELESTSDADGAVDNEMSTMASGSAISHPSM